MRCTQGLTQRYFFAGMNKRAMPESTSTVTRKFGPMMKVMDSASGLGANHSRSRNYGADLQRCHEAEAALLCGEIIGSLY